MTMDDYKFTRKYVNRIRPQQDLSGLQENSFCWLAPSQFTKLYATLLINILPHYSPLQSIQGYSLCPQIYNLIPCTPCCGEAWERGYSLYICLRAPHASVKFIPRSKPLVSAVVCHQRVFSHLNILLRSGLICIKYTAYNIMFSLMFLLKKRRCRKSFQKVS